MDKEPLVELFDKGTTVRGAVDSDERAKGDKERGITGSTVSSNRLESTGTLLASERLFGAVDASVKGSRGPAFAIFWYSRFFFRRRLRE